MNDAPPNIAIHGSCVTRDLAESEQWTVTAYQARSSMCTKGSPAVPFDARLLEKAPNGWQRRMVEWDLERHELDCAGAKCLIVDFIDERHAVFDFEGALATESFYFAECGIAASVGRSSRRLSHGESEYWEAFERGCRHVAARTTCPIIIHDASWATLQRTDHGLVPLEDAEYSSAQNRDLARMVEVASRVFQPIGVLRAPDLAIADPQHRWGLAAFHYVAEYYKEIAGQFERVWRTL